MYSIYIEKVWYLYSINILLLVVYIQLIGVYVHTVRFLQVWDLFCRKQDTVVWVFKYIVNVLRFGNV